MLPCLMIEFNSANSKHIKLTYDVITLYIHLCKIEKEPNQKKDFSTSSPNSWLQPKIVKMSL